jgi:hypothetical protein
MQHVTAGIYQHYKGQSYQVLAVGRHTETAEDVVIYQPLYESDVAYWVRPYAMFIERVVVDGKDVPRFKKVDEDNDER